MPTRRVLADMLAQVNRWPLWERKLPVRGRAFRATSLDRLAYLALHAVGVMGSTERQFFEASVKPGMTVVDVGANLGVYTLLFSDLVGPSGRVVAFEPDPRLFAACSENCAGRANVTLVRAAVGASCGRRAFVSGGLNSGDNRLLADGADPRGTDVVDVVTLDESLGNAVDLVKVDVQGREPYVFSGMGDALGRVPVFFEFWPIGLREVGIEPSAFLEDLTRAGYALTEPIGAKPGAPVEAAELIARLGQRGYANLLARPSERLVTL